MRKISTVLDMLTLYNEFKKDLATDGHPNITPEHFLEVIQDNPDDYEISILLFAILE